MCVCGALCCASVCVLRASFVPVCCVRARCLCQVVVCAALFVCGVIGDCVVPLCVVCVRAVCASVCVVRAAVCEMARSCEVVLCVGVASGRCVSAVVWCVRRRVVQCGGSASCCASVVASVLCSVCPRCVVPVMCVRLCCDQVCCAALCCASVCRRRCADWPEGWMCAVLVGAVWMCAVVVTSGCVNAGL
ncbi:hypothetical protein GDO81_017118 [Engystomops pustulosus]|uniref:Uncharacterized protein n=1 Tax=Engystomops pustulosus TaxID=76066 RepID=A0AAV7AF04_ENGPU|nr:hypothetical protein GDO81_017118 [Engystomops pustulosus]